MSLLARIRLHRPQAAAAPVALPIVSVPAPELGDDDLEQVVGGLERVFIPGVAGAGG